MNNDIRTGKFTSSNIHKLMKTDKSGRGFGKPAITYIEEKRIEIKLGRSLDLDNYSRAMTWGLFLENRVYSLLSDLSYQLVSKDTIVHKTINRWAGTPDLIVNNKKISDIKCYQPKNFALYTDAILTKDVELLKKEFPQEYWQLVSNAIICNVDYAEAITYMPYKSELNEIREEALNYEGLDMWKYRFIYEEPDDNLPYLPNNGYYKNLNIFTFKVPSKDKLLLTQKVKKATKLLDKII